MIYGCQYFHAVTGLEQELFVCFEVEVAAWVIVINNLVQIDEITHPYCIMLIERYYRSLFSKTASAIRDNPNWLCLRAFFDQQAGRRDALVLKIYWGDGDWFLAWICKFYAFKAHAWLRIWLGFILAWCSSINDLLVLWLFLKVGKMHIKCKINCLLWSII